VNGSVEVTNRYQLNASRTNNRALDSISVWDQLALMPTLYGVNVAIARYEGKTPISHIWAMLVFFLASMVMIVATALNASPLYRLIHFGVTVFYTVMNFLHVALDLRVEPIEWYQITLVSILFVVGVILNVVASQWLM